MQAVIVYRDTILPKSELAFMQRQYLAFERLRPIWVGRRVEPWFAHARSDLKLGPIFGGVGGSLFKFAGLVPRLQELKELQAVCVHAQFGRGGALALPLAMKLKLPLVVTMHGGEDKHAHFRRFPLPALYRLRLRRLQSYATAFVCVSPGVRKRLIARGFPAEKAIVLPIGIDLPAAPPDERTARRGILFVGRFVEMKGLPILIEAVRQLRSRGCDEPLVIAGDGPDRAAVEDSVRGISNVELTGWRSQDEVGTLLAGARVLCIPSVRARSGEIEGLPSVAPEAAARGTPIVGSTEAGLEGLVSDRISGLIFPSRDARALADCLESLLGSPDHRAAMAKEAFRILTRDFDARLQSRRLEEILIAAAAGMPPRPSPDGTV